MFDDYLEFIPEDKRDSFKALAQKAIVITSREDAAKYLTENQYFKSEKDALISRTTDSYAERFKAEKLDGIVEARIRELNPPKDAKDQAIADMQKELLGMRREAILEKRRAEATAKLSELGLPVNLADFAIDEDENIFSNKIERLSGLKAWGEELKKSALAGAVGTQRTPQQGAPVSSDLESRYAQAIQSGDITTAIAIKGRMATQA